MVKVNSYVCPCRVSWILEILVVVAKENVDRMSDIVHRFGHRKVRVVTGGSTRHRSIWNGVQALAEVRPEVVIIHDAVRPFVEEDFLYQISLAAKEHGVSSPRETSGEHVQVETIENVGQLFCHGLLASVCFCCWSRQQERSGLWFPP